MKWDIDLGNEQIKETPFAERKFISILLGAAFLPSSQKVICLSKSK